MLPVELHVNISAPREEIFDLVSDLALRVAWTDNYQSYFRLAHPDSRGEGAGARYVMRAPAWRLWVETAIVEADRPRKIVERTHGGRGGRTKGAILWNLESMGPRLTRVELTILSEPGTPREVVKEKLGVRGWIKRNAKASLERLRMIFEEPSPEPPARASVAGFEDLKAPRFGMHPQRTAAEPRG